ncbi:hypothetical protein [Streptomyces sp. CB01881]|uniref:hypothetical protein n=1 Tax=Streptomyces sp. CB01881 TaxID=2078691 RepID=UPI000CDC4F7F|nr:hypothetical protein [Streptomyces sp. CB01881]AUY53334.1 hypothetical protein C2142_35545 [Streptomyces sp. CB01881]TYC69487.1 hypothetical protein EH183_35605 [Streptomyces sp. CB01881]
MSDHTAVILLACLMTLLLGLLAGAAAAWLAHRDGATLPTVVTRGVGGCTGTLMLATSVAALLVR